MVKLCNRIIYTFELKSSMCMENEEWDALDNICARENIKRDRLLELILKVKNSNAGLTSTVRVFTIAYHYHAAMLNMSDAPKDAITTPLFETIKDIL